MKYKNKFSLKLLYLILALIFLILTIISIRSTYARYVTSLTAKSYVDLGRWMILVNNQNIIENSDLSDVITPVFSEDSEYIADGKIVPTSSGYIDITIDYSNVTVPFKYELSFEQAEETLLEDFRLTDYSIDGIPVESLDGVISSVVVPDEVTDKTQTMRLNFGWYDGKNEVLDDIDDTNYSYNNDSLQFKFSISFTQLQPSDI